MGIVSLIIVGLIAGILAKIAMPGPDPGGIILTIVIGIVGALIGGYVIELLGGPRVTGINLSSILVATLGSIILLAIYRLITRRAA
ncbi:MAG: GlsB/YeaQ/YmgE family stress response membrane protein [Actinomycetota bacterium]|nr:GlsB/YeaQ/YmgE family stress response membrane protein [Actinomycetota bacterium]